ncbi:ERCC4 domain containing protein [Coccidioides posadasii C735 delta SOWgp]|uniref:Crossover junction endonuclease MUS81 n=1 Tax=Coccidioides posadasii (strain C735) TaxID=222929 RepID=C5PA47_COCP7|nr:ERCC4 domain containing protein [Coccidioides posadasii C735 delta SOWgp]EER26609.1 ERCC4 domain containing protein [Coccidioides posadasii C735 delta SOWgp]|eukprot:XP_003068754.1 ERCC4 domain containing protein [Coccidioides posadasii C735 delta SOWgp]
MADYSCANPLLLRWIKEWLDEARERSSKGFTVYKKAYDSMKACPLTFSHPLEAQQLNGLGPKLCERLTVKLQDYCRDNGLPMPEVPHTVEKAKGKRKTPEVGGCPEVLPTKRARKPRTYIPTLRSGPYALLLALATLEEKSSIGATKAQLIEAAQPHCDTSFTAPSDPTKFYTAWNSMKTLVTKDLVYEHGRPLKRYLLTDQGRETARLIQNTQKSENIGPGPGNSVASSRRFGQEIVNATQDSLREPQHGMLLYSSKSRENAPYFQLSNIIDLDNFNDIPDVSSAGQYKRTTAGAGLSGSNRPQHIPSFTSTSPIPLSSQNFTVELVLDVREIRTPRDRDYISNELIRRGVEPIVRSLELGDALWVAKFKDPNFLAQYGEEGDEIMLDWIVERKRLDDLVSSIRDGRFHEQKFRLRRSGVKNVIYLVEEFVVGDPSNASAASVHEAVTSAIASTQVVNGYFVKKTRNLDDTIRYLARMTSLLRKMFSDPCDTSNSSGFTHSSISLIPTHGITTASSYLETLGRLRAKEDEAVRVSVGGNTSTIYGLTFPTFSALSSKSDMLTLRDLFLKMLMCTRGVTGEKALEIQRRWPTPRQFVEAFEAVDTGDAEGKKRVEEMLFSKMGNLVGRKKVGKALSKRISEVWARQK